MPIEKKVFGIFPFDYWNVNTLWKKFVHLTAYFPAGRRDYKIWTQSITCALADILYVDFQKKGMQSVGFDRNWWIGQVSDVQQTALGVPPYLCD